MNSMSELIRNLTLDALSTRGEYDCSDVFLAGTMVMALAAVTCIFLREIPLRRSVRGDITTAESEVGVSVPTDAPVMRPAIAPDLGENR